MVCSGQKRCGIFATYRHSSEPCSLCRIMNRPNTARAALRPTGPRRTRILSPSCAPASARSRCRIKYGVEARALESLRQVFDQARDAIKKHPGCKQFTDGVTQMLNNDLRPVAAGRKWHRADGEGEPAQPPAMAPEPVPDRSAKCAGKAAQVRRPAASDGLRRTGCPPMPFSKPMPESELSPSAADDIPSGIVDGLLIPDEMIGQDQWRRSRRHIRRRRVRARRRRRPTAGMRSGWRFPVAAIRSATSLLPRRGAGALAGARSAQDVDFLSTVSGGGYVGCFLTTLTVAAARLISRRRKSIWTGLPRPSAIFASTRNI